MIEAENWRENSIYHLKYIDPEKFEKKAVVLPEYASLYSNKPPVAPTTPSIYPSLQPNVGMVSPKYPDLSDANAREIGKSISEMTSYIHSPVYSKTPQSGMATCLYNALSHILDIKVKPRKRGNMFQQ